MTSYWDYANANLEVIHNNDLARTSATAATLDSGGVNVTASVTNGADGLGLISHHASTNQDVKVAHCSSAFCVPYLWRR